MRPHKISPVGELFCAADDLVDIVAKLPPNVGHLSSDFVAIAVVHNRSSIDARGIPCSVLLRGHWPVRGQAREA
jgi:hypothetical protein